MAVAPTPERTAAITVRLTPQEKERLVAYALANDLHAGQAARHFIARSLRQAEEQERAVERTEA